MRRLAIFGAGGHGKVVADAALLNGWDKIEFFDDKWPTVRQCGIWCVNGGTAELCSSKDQYDGIIVAIGDNQIRVRRINQFLDLDFRLVSVIHPSAIISPYTTIDKGTVVLAGAVINPYAKIGMGTIINTAASIDHDCELADGVHICPGVHLAGEVLIGTYSMVGIGAAIKQQICIGYNVIIGAGSVVVSDIESNSIAFGVPAKVRSKLSC